MLVVVVDDGFPCCLCLPAGLPAIQPVVGGSAELSAGMAGKPACGSSSSEREEAALVVVVMVVVVVSGQTTPLCVTWV